MIPLWCVGFPLVLFSAKNVPQLNPTQNFIHPDRHFTSLEGPAKFVKVNSGVILWGAKEHQTFSQPDLIWGEWNRYPNKQVEYASKRYSTVPTMYRACFYVVYIVWPYTVWYSHKLPLQLFPGTFKSMILHFSFGGIWTRSLQGIYKSHTGDGRYFMDFSRCQVWWPHSGWR